MATTVQNIIDQLPIHVKNRYANSFWLSKMNILLGDLEAETDQSPEIKESPILLVESVTNYDIPSDLRRVIRVRTVAVGDVSTVRTGDPQTEPPWRILENKIRLNDLPEYSNNADISGTVAAIESNNTIVSGVLRTDINDSDDLVSRLITLTHAADSSVEYRIISSSDIESTEDTLGDITTATDQSNFKSTDIIGATDDYYNNFTVTVTFDATGNTETRTISDYVSADGTVTVSAAFTETITTSDTFTINAGIALPNGLFDTTLVVGDTFTITSNFYMVEGWEQKVKFTDVTDTLPIDEEFEDWFVNGLRYLGELQTDAESKAVPLWFNAYRKSKKKYKSYYRKPVGDQRKQIVNDGWESI